MSKLTRRFASREEYAHYLSSDPEQTLSYLAWCRHHQYIPDYVDLTESEKLEVADRMIANGLLDLIRATEQKYD